jgi:hypothetical protein
LYSRRILNDNKWGHLTDERKFVTKHLCHKPVWVILFQVKFGITRAREFLKELLTEKRTDGSVLVWLHYWEKESDWTIILCNGNCCGCQDHIAY